MGGFISDSLEDLLGYMSPEAIVHILHDLGEYRGQLDPDGVARRIEKQIASYAEFCLGVDDYEKIQPYLPKE